MLVPILVVLGLMIFIPIVLQIGANIGMKKSLGKRGDGTVSIKYPLPSEQKDLVYKKDYFYNKYGNRFSVYEYRHKDVKKPKAVLLMIHGIGAGHFYLFSMINYFAKLGYLIVAYDQYASGTSEGKRIDTMTVGGRDVKYALEYVDKNYSDLPLYVFGHSWGGFTASIALNYSSRIEKAIIVSGFNRMGDFVRGGKNPCARFVGFLLSLAIISRDAFLLKGESNFSMEESLKKTKAKVLYIQGTEDKVVNPEFSGIMLTQLNKNPNVEIKFFKDKGHTPFVTKECEAKQGEIGSKFGTLGGVLVPFKDTYDFAECSKIDLQVCKYLSDFLDK